jgi:sn-glycerol 3-phosphate transport system ATP-binding protein
MNVVSLPSVTGDGFLLGVRPEDIRLGTEGFNAGFTAGLVARVETVEYLGADSIVTCRAGSERLTVRLPGQASLSRETETKLSWDREAVHLFDAASGLRVERTDATATFAV